MEPTEIIEQEGVVIKDEETDQEFENLEEFIEEREKRQREAAIEEINHNLDNKFGLTLEDLTQDFEDSPQEMVEQAIQNTELDIKFTEEDAEFITGLVIQLVGERITDRLKIC